MPSRLAKAVQAIKDGQYPDARQILTSILREDPFNEQAWLFLAVCVDEHEKKMDCLQRVLEINPENHHALHARNKLINTRSQQINFQDEDGKIHQTDPLLKRIFDLLFHLPAAFYAAIFFVIFLLAAFAYINLNTDYWGLGSPNFASYTIEDDYQSITDSRSATWRIVYESQTDTTFEGKVRHISVNRIKKIPFLTHDILITSGDYADPDLVFTSVTNHHYFWKSRTNAYPKGTINLLHVIPENEEIYHQLLKIRTGDSVTVSGREILKIDAFNDQGESLGWWKDAGCNTTLVKKIQAVD